MKKQNVIGGALVILVAVVVLSGCTIERTDNSRGGNLDKGIKRQANTVQEEYVIDESDFVKGAQLIDNIEKGEISVKESEGLVHMREEEKLARDVYATLYEKWGQNIFTNISKSEQTHMDAVGTLLERYDIKDPIKDDSRGRFTSMELQKLYDELVEKGSGSLDDALVVGVTIEDLDIYDLDRFIKNVDQEDIKIVYQNLNKGSHNHLRAFMRNLERSGREYKAQFVSQERFDQILGAEQVKGSVDANGVGTGLGQSGKNNTQGSGGGNTQGRGIDNARGIVSP